MAEANAKAESSCKRCHRRKKRCDRSLPECRACHHAGASCSFLDDKTQVASYPIAYVSRSSLYFLTDNTDSYVQKLERRVKELESQFSAPSSSRTSQNDPLGCYWGQDPEVLLDNILIPDNLGQSPQMQWLENPVNTVPISPPDLTTQKADNLAEELRVLSLQAAAERYLGSSSGISFAKLTQTVLQRLSPDPDGFVFDRNLDNISQTDPNPNLLSSYSPVFADMYTSFASPLTFSPTFDPPIEDYELTDLSLLEASHISYILDFYFAHSHTLYPFIRKDEFIAVLWRIYADPLDPLAQSPLWQLRIWMVLAIGSTTYCSVSLTDESEPTRLYNKAMTYFEAAMRCGDLVSITSHSTLGNCLRPQAGLEVLMLQVSYSFFNKIGPSMLNLSLRTLLILQILGFW